MNNPISKGNGAAMAWILAHVDYQGDDCLTWPFSRLNGYGRGGHNGTPFYANRMMCEKAHGPPPTPEHEAAHSCGNGPQACTNPRHLSWKTPSANQLDRAAHGNPNVWGGRGKLTPEQAAEIRALRGKKTQTEIAKIYGLTQPAVSFIQLGKRYSDKKVRLGKGYSLDKKSGKFSARIGVNKGSIFLGRFDKEEDARTVFLAADARVRAGLPVHREMFRISPSAKSGG